MAHPHPDELSALAAAVLGGGAPVFHPNTGQQLSRPADATQIPLSPGARAGLEAPRYCQLCGRRMKVQVYPTGWSATCSRHGDLESGWLER